VQEGLIKTYADLYTLTQEQVIPLDRMAEKSADNLIKGIQKSKEILFERVLFGLGIRYVGETVAKKLAKHYKNINAIMNATEEELVQVDEIGIKIAQSVQEFFSQPQNVTLVEELQSHGVQLEFSADQLEGQTDVLRGKTFVVSGVFEKISRNELKKLIEDNGGKVSSSISSKTSYLVAGDNMGPSKLKKANDLDIAMVSEDEFLEMIMV